MSEDDIKKTVRDFVTATERSDRASFDVIELHGAHGYLLHQFLSPLSNKRADSYGGSLKNRMRFPLEVTKAVRAVWPQDKPLFMRISATDWVEGGWDQAQSIEFAKKCRELGVDLIDVSTGGNAAHAKIPVGPGYQVKFAEAIRKEASVPTGAVGLITTSQQAEAILVEGQADVIFLARELLRDPYFPLRAAHELGVTVKWPLQYERAALTLKK